MGAYKNERSENREKRQKEETEKIRKNKKGLLQLRVACDTIYDMRNPCDTKCDTKCITRSNPDQKWDRGICITRREKKRYQIRIYRNTKIRSCDTKCDTKCITKTCS